MPQAPAAVSKGDYGAGMNRFRGCALSCYTCAIAFPAQVLQKDMA